MPDGLLIEVTTMGWEYLLFRSFHLWSQLCKRKRSFSPYTLCSTFRYSGRADWRKDSVKRNAASMNFYVNKLTPGYDELLSRHRRRIEITIIPTIITSSSASSSMWSSFWSKSSVIRILIVTVKNYNTQIVEGFTCRKRRLRSTFLLIL